MTQDSKKGDGKKDGNKKKPEKSSSSSSASVSSSASEPSTVLDEVSNEAFNTANHRPSHGEAASRAKTHQKHADGKLSGTKKKSESKSASRVASSESCNLKKNIKRSRIMSKTNNVVPLSRPRTNPSKTDVPNNRNVPLEATATDIVDKTIVDTLDPINVFTADVREEFETSIVHRLAGTDCDPFVLLNSDKGCPESKSFLDRHVDPHKLITFMVRHMTAYYDLERDKDTFSKQRQLMDDQLWDTMAYIIPLICRQMNDLLRDEPLIVQVPADKVVVFGDLHGNFNDVHYIYKHFIVNPEYAHHRFVFLGDYVDRGPKPIEILCFLFAHKLAYPHRFILLRGNHEVLKVNRKYGFKAVCEHVFHDTYIKNPVIGDLVYQSFNRTFTYLPLGAVVDGTPGRRVFLCHGGAPSQYLKPKASRNSGWTIQELNLLMEKPTILTPSKRAPPQEMALSEILWNDPIPERCRDDPKCKRKLFYKNKKRGGHCSFFTGEGLKAFLKVICVTVHSKQSNNFIILRNRQTSWRWSFVDINTGTASRMASRAIFPGAC